MRIIPGASSAKDKAFTLGWEDLLLVVASAVLFGCLDLPVQKVALILGRLMS